MLIKSITFNKGFTLVELIVVVVLVGIMAALGGRLIIMPIRSFADTSRRSELVDTADNALQRMTRELRSALPNSIRISSSGTRTAIEFLNTATGGRYRAHVESGGTGNPLLNGASDTFDVLDGIVGTVSPGPSGQANCLNGSSDCLVIYNTGSGAGSFNAYNGDNIAAITAVDLVNSQLTFNNGGSWSFPFPIPPAAQQRFYVVDKPVSFVCDTAARQLWRYENYTISAVQPVSVAAFGSAGNLLADNVSACQFNYDAGAGTRNGLVTLRVQIQGSVSGEGLALLHQVHVINVP